MQFRLLQKLVRLWAKKRNLLKPQNQYKQMLKCVSEVGELSDALIKQDEQGIKDGIGDVLVTLIILSDQLKYDPIECLQIAYDEISERKGKTVNGTFIKDENTPKK